MKKNLFTYMIPKGSDVLNHIVQFNQKINNLLHVGVTLDEEDKALQLPVTLDPFFLMFVNNFAV